ncbi:hypothetical protein [Pseudoflavonifractor phocaeensis]|uniref:hypothetical protein n=1 Tax=Pseudoflavonifractor phocaeensis TaxID=1870988 RepID=UPI001959220D|nr:hypothetical protein [Pseudoflavonifractor phocaeensis]
MPNNFGLFFTRDNTVIRLPVNPEKLPVARGNENDDYNVLGLGPIMVPRLPSLRVVTISSFFPGRVSPLVLTPNKFQPPEFYIQFFEAAMKEKAPILYTPARYYENGEPFMTGDAGFEVLVTRFDTEERGGETGDFYYDLELTEYKDYAPQTMQAAASTTDAGSAAAAAQPAQVTTEPARSIPQGQLVVGSACTLNGPYYYSSYGDEPHGSGNGKQVLVSRIVDLSRAYPYHVTNLSGGALGWVTAASLQVVSTT